MLEDRLNIILFKGIIMPTELSDFTNDLRQYTGTQYISVLTGLKRQCRTSDADPTMDSVCFTISGCSSSNNCYYKGGSLLDLNSVYPGATVTDISNIFERTDRNITWGNIVAKELSLSYQGAFSFDDAKIRQIRQDIHDLSGSLAKTSYDTDFQDMITKQKNNRITRDKLDRKMQSLYETENSDVIMRYDNSVYTTLIWTVMTTSILYYLFIKL
jgi:hypothetical protein